VDIVQKMSLRQSRINRMIPIFGDGAEARVHLSEVRYWKEAKQLEGIIDGMKPELERTCKKLEAAHGGIRR